MKKETLNTVKEVAEMTSNLSNLSVDKINEAAPKIKEPEVEIDIKAKAAQEGVRYIEPKKKLQPFGKLDPKWKRQRDKDWEYVKGMFQSEVVNGRNSNEPKTFWFSKWPGDHDCLWEIPVNTPVYVPRMIAFYLSGEKDPDTGMESMKYHTFDYVQRPETYWRPDEYTHQFAPTGTHYRGRFVPLGAF